MRQFDVFQNPNPASRSYAPYVVMLQSHHLDLLDTVFIAPLVRDVRRSLTLLDLPVHIRGEELTIVIAEAAGVPRRGFGSALTSLADREDEIRRAFERLMTGF